MKTKPEEKPTGWMSTISAECSAYTEKAMKITLETRPVTIDDGADLWDGVPRMLGILRDENGKTVHLVRSDAIPEPSGADDHAARAHMRAQLTNFMMTCNETKQQIERGEIEV